MSNYQPHQDPYLQQAPPATDNTKTILLIIGIILGAIVMFILVCGGSVYYIASTAKKKVVAAQEDARQKSQRRPSTSNPFSRTPAKNFPSPAKPINNEPKDLPSAARELHNTSAHTQSRALQWLKGQKFDRKHQVEIRDGLMSVIKTGMSSRRREALALLKTWGDKSIAKELAMSLKRKSEVREKLALLTRYKDPQTAPMVAELFTDYGYANETDETLRAIGAESAPHLIRFLSDHNSRTKTRAEVLLAEFGVDVKKAELEGLAQRLQNATERESRDVFNRLARLERDKELQPTISKAITSKLPTKDVYVGKDALRALQVWGDKSSNSKVLEQFRSHPHPDEECIKFLMKYPDERALPIMVTELQHGGDRGENAVQALINLGQESVSATVPLVNSHHFQNRENSRKVLAAIEGTQLQVIKQCVTDLGNVDHRIGENASRLLQEMDFVEKAQPAVADALTSFLLKHTNNRYAQPAFIRWSTSKQADDLFLLTDNRDDAIWLPAFKRLLELKEYKLLYNSSFKLLADRHRRLKLSEYLKTADNPEIESMMIRLAGTHTSEDALVEVCDVLATIGGKESVSALRKLESAARSEKSARVYSASSRAGQAITARLRKQE